MLSQEKKILPANKWVLIGEGSLLAGCGDVLLRAGHGIAAVVSSEPAIGQWAAERGIRVEGDTGRLTALLAEIEFDHLASITHLAVIPGEALRLGQWGRARRTCAKGEGLTITLTTNHVEPA